MEAESPARSNSHRPYHAIEYRIRCSYPRVHRFQFEVAQLPPTPSYLAGHIRNRQPSFHEERRRLLPQPSPTLFDGNNHCEIVRSPTDDASKRSRLDVSTR